MIDPTLSALLARHARAKAELLAIERELRAAMQRHADANGPRVVPRIEALRAQVGL